jgi:Bifunctional DNA primase/polymerase, N-terminal/Primase C terminal 2 (PriCT-2)
MQYNDTTYSSDNNNAGNSNTNPNNPGNPCDALGVGDALGAVVVPGGGVAGASVASGAGAASGDTRAAKCREYALAYLEAGFNIIRLHPIDADGVCQCHHTRAGDECKQAGKHPIDKKESRPDYRIHDAILEMHLADGQFDCGYGVLLDDSGVLVVDVDVRDNGKTAPIAPVTYRTLIENIPEIAGAGLVVASGSGGGSKHLYFKAPDGIRFKMRNHGLDSIDLKTSGWVVGPGSRHKSGGVYSVSIGSIDDIDAVPPAFAEQFGQDLKALRSRGGRLTDGVIHLTSAHDGLAIAAQAVKLIDSHDRSTWLEVGGHLRAEFDDVGFDLWDKWSALASNYDEKIMLRQWDSLADFEGGIENLIGMVHGKVPEIPVGAFIDEFDDLREAISQIEKQHKQDLSAGIWEESTPISGSPGESYLAALGITAPAGDVLRFNASAGWLRDASGAVAGPRAAIVAKLSTGGVVRLFTDVGEVWALGDSWGGVAVMSQGSNLAIASDMLDAIALAANLPDTCVIYALHPDTIMGLKPGGKFKSAMIFARDENEYLMATHLAGVWRNAGGAPMAGARLPDGVTSWAEAVR